jgi:hypothetical protein
MRHVATLLAAIAVLTASCGTAQTESGGEASTSTPPTAATTSKVAPTTIAEASAASPPAAETPTGLTSSVDLEVVQVKELEYLVDNEGAWTLDVFYPTEAGPWPLVVIFPGACDNCAATTQARLISQKGAVVAAPRYWHGVGSSTPTDYLVGRIHNDRAACAVGYAQKIATDYGARADQTTVVGFSAGVHPAGWIGLGVANDETCAEPIRHLPVGLVVGDSQFIFQDAIWDGGFENAQDGARETIDRYLNPDRWHVSENLIVYLWSTESTLTSRAIEDSPPPESWVWSRDTTGTLVEDLQALRALDDGIVDFYDNALLLEQRMLDEGIVVTTVQYPGDHNYNAEVYDRIIEVATGQSD